MLRDTGNPYDSPGEGSRNAPPSSWRFIPTVVFGVQGVLFALGAGLPIIISICAPVFFDVQTPPVNVPGFALTSASGLIGIFSAFRWYQQKWRPAIVTTIVGFIVMALGGLCS